MIKNWHIIRTYYLLQKCRKWSISSKRYSILCAVMHLPRHVHVYRVCKTSYILFENWFTTCFELVLVLLWIKLTFDVWYCYLHYSKKVLLEVYWFVRKKLYKITRCPLVEHWFEMFFIFCGKSMTCST